jgi:uncharacterized protein (TIGR02757 family)
MPSGADPLLVMGGRREGEYTVALEPPSGPDGMCFEALYERFNRREFLHPDPLEFLFQYTERCDQEVVGLIASSLAYGRVAQILKSVSRVLEMLGDSPSAFLLEAAPSTFEESLQEFRHRFTTGAEMSGLLIGIGETLRECGSLESCFVEGMRNSDETVIPALEKFVARLSGFSGERPQTLLALPERGSACKRLHLYLRWMVRRDEIDPGPWQHVSPAKLVVPVDTHMHRISRALGLTQRRQADIRTALEITEGFRRFAPADPVKYDFAITRIGINPGTLFEFIDR